MVNLFNWHPVLQDLSITTQHFKWCINFSVLKLSALLKTTQARHTLMPKFLTSV